MTKEREDHIKTMVRTAYEAVGTSFACQVADEMKETDYGFCWQCNCLSPIIKGENECLVCGQETIKDPHTEDIPLENYEI